MVKYLYFILFISLPVITRAQMEFVENRGQWHQNVQYRGDFLTGSIFLEKQGFTVLMHDTADLRRRSEIVHGHGELPSPGEKLVMHSFAYKLNLIGANDKPIHLGEKPLEQYNNYFIGNNPAQWASYCKLFHTVVFKDVYPNIDLRYYSQGDALKYDFVVHPGGNPSHIAMRYDGPQVKAVGKELHLITPVGTVRELYPYTYQQSGGQTSVIDCRYVVKKNVVTFRLRDYDPTKTLVIDPSVIFCSFTGSTADNWGYTATPGPDGSLFAGGIVFGAGYPVSPGAFQTSFGGGTNEDNLGGFDIGIFKFSPNGTNRLYATYLGGSGNEQPHSIISDGNGNLVVAGRTTSPDYPVNRPGLGPLGGSDIMITKLSADGGSLIGSIKIGGSGQDGVNIRSKTSTPAGLDNLRQNYGDDARSEVILDANNNIVLASCTQSDDFYTSLGAAQSVFGGSLQDGVILKFNHNLSTNIFSTYFGGSANDACYVASIHPITGNIYVGGGTASNDLPGSTAGRWQSIYNGGLTDGFVTIINPNGTAFLNTTYVGTSGRDQVYGLKFDARGFPYIMGTTTGGWQVINATFSNAGGKQFITKLQEDLSGVVYSTVFGTNSPEPNISPVAFMVDRCENVYVSGWGGGINISHGYSSGSTSGLPMVDPILGIPSPDGQDFYFFVMERNAVSQYFGSHFGQNGGVGDHVDGGTSRFDENGVIYMAMCANCGDRNTTIFPATPGAWAVTNGSANCNEAVVKIEMNFAGVGSSVQTTINSVVGSRRGCVPLTVQFADTLQQGVRFYWDYGDGTKDTTSTYFSEHTYTAIGVYPVMLISEDSTTCNIRDTAYTSINVGSNRAFPDFEWAKVPPCESLAVSFTNTSTRLTGNFGANAFVWDYGDGSPPDTTNFSPPRQHAYPGPGTYFVVLTIIDTNYCNTPISDTQRISLNATVKAQFNTLPMGCAPYAASFTNTSLGGTDWLWEFGDGTTSTEFEPVHEYTLPGTYDVRLIATDTSTCNRVDTSAYFTITVYERPTAIISSWSPNPPVPNTPVSFTNGSMNAIRYWWNFGDGETSVETAPSHQYNATGNYRVTLVAYNAAGCTDTALITVRVLIEPLLDVPNAFTPGQFGENSIVRVKGFGIGKMSWNIYNRFGQLVFQSNSPKQGWDGTFKGKLQPMDVYTYTLDVEFTDGQKLRRTGDITLLR